MGGICLGLWFRREGRRSLMAKWVKDPALPLQWLWWLDPWSGNFCGCVKKKKGGKVSGCIVCVLKLLARWIRVQD